MIWVWEWDGALAITLYVAVPTLIIAFLLWYYIHKLLAFIRRDKSKLKTHTDKDIENVIEDIFDQIGDNSIDISLNGSHSDVHHMSHDSKSKVKKWKNGSKSCDTSAGITLIPTDEDVKSSKSRSSKSSGDSHQSRLLLSKASERYLTNRSQDSSSDNSHQTYRVKSKTSRKSTEDIPKGQKPSKPPRTSVLTKESAIDVKTYHELGDNSPKLLDDFSIEMLMTSDSSSGSVKTVIESKKLLNTSRKSSECDTSLMVNESNVSMRPMGPFDDNMTPNQTIKYSDKKDVKRSLSKRIGAKSEAVFPRFQSDPNSTHMTFTEVIDLAFDDLIKTIDDFSD
ncbi:unnamed protein product [Oppiella nova]|uniref:Uncharacterized protein n=1 Tax=Oppiella nova TaxID=334625 RepID=A0A7R9QQT4_9ACAR|nr:unnamed protein product [Oppiella nova]CAG2172074.1 unnamed protein product [Oppiella nova]